MILNFNPYYDSEVYLKEKDCGIGMQFLGENGLLNELELRAGMTCLPMDETKRTIYYMKAMRDAVSANPAIFFKDSFERDDFGTAEVLLRWRDALVRAGWTQPSETSSTKLDGLKKVEAYFSCKGRADRWRDILNILKDKTVLRNSDEVIVWTAEENLDPLMRDVFSAIKTHGCTVVFKGDDTIENSPEIYSFKNDIEAHEWIASLDLGDADVLVGVDRSMMNSMLKTAGHKLIGATDDGIGPVMRVFSLGLSLFTKPIDVTTLVSFLQIKENPLRALHLERQRKDGSKYYVQLNNCLADIICKKGGIGDEWTQAIADAKYDYSGALANSARRNELLQLTCMWEKVREKAGHILVAKKQDVLDFLHIISNWAKRNLNVDGVSFVQENNTEQYRAVINNCEALELILSYENNEIETNKLKKWAGRISKAVALNSEYARAGAVHFVNDPADIHSHPSRIFWFCSESNAKENYRYGFLSGIEISSLSKEGTLIEPFEKELLSRHALQVSGLSKGKLTIIKCDKIGPEKTSPNLIVSELEKKFSVTPLTAKAAKTESDAVITDFGKDFEHKFDKDILCGFTRDESYSSVDQLIMHPFDYYVEKILKYEDYGTSQVGDLASVKGTIAHKYIETIGKKCCNDVSLMTAMHIAQFDSMLDVITQERGLMLQSEENIISYKGYKIRLKKSIDTLLEIISAYKLSIVEFEHKFDVEIMPFGKFKGSIDCLLKTNEDEYVIFDFKWNEGSTYEKKIQENRALQLAMYRKAIKKEYGKDPLFCGYYVFPKMTLFSSDATLGPNPHFELLTQENTNDIFVEACESYKYRREQLEKGILEDADGMPFTSDIDGVKIPNFQYVADTITKKLYPLDSYDGKKKDYAYGRKNFTLKGDLK